MGNLLSCEDREEKKEQEKLSKVFPNNEKYNGNFKKNIRHGEGHYFFSNGDRYEGFWENDQKSGKGTLYYADGSLYIGQWSEIIIFKRKKLFSIVNFKKFKTMETIKSNFAIKLIVKKIKNNNIQ